MQDFSDSRDADDARYSLNGREVDGSRLIVEFAKGVSTLNWTLTIFSSFVTCYVYILSLLHSFKNILCFTWYRFHVVQVVLENIWAEGPLLGLDVASIVALIGTRPENTK